MTQRRAAARDRAALVEKCFFMLPPSRLKAFTNCPAGLLTGERAGRKNSTEWMAASPRTSRDSMRQGVYRLSVAGGVTSFMRPGTRRSTGGLVVFKFSYKKLDFLRGATDFRIHLFGRRR